MERKAYAKLNLALAITGRLENGYHTLDMVMQQVDLHDVVEVREAEGIHVQCGGVDCGEQSNTAYKAARLFFDKTGIKGGAGIRIEKNIPSQAGLGGGSSDAAATLLLLNDMFNAGLSTQEMCGIAVRVGADVPFFLMGGCARAQGIGEVLEPLQNNCGFSYLLVKPEGGVDTAAAYSTYHRLPKDAVDVRGAIDALAAGDRQAYFKSTGNALFAAGRELCPTVAQAVDDCYNAGAEFAMMTGSGSCVFAIFGDEGIQERARHMLAGKYPFVCTAKGML